MDILDWLRDKMYTGEYDPSIMDSSLGMPPQNHKLSNFGRVVKGLPGMLQSGVAAAATPNIANGGPTDIFRAMQAGQSATQDRDLLNYNINRQRTQDANTLSQKRLEDAIKWAQLENTQENTSSVIAERKAQDEARDYQKKVNELNRQLSLGQAGAHDLGEGTPASTEQITPGISLETNAQPPDAHGGYTFKDPFSNRTLVVPKKNGDVEITPELGQEIGIVPNAEGKYVASTTELAAAIRNKTKAPPPPRVTRSPTPQELALGAQGVQLPEDIGLNATPAQFAGASEILKPPREPRQIPEGQQEKERIAAARNKVFTENGRDWNKVVQNLDKYQADPLVSPYLDQIFDHAQKQIQAGAQAAKANGAVELLQKRANNASATGGRILQKIDVLQRNYPKLFGNVIGGGAASTAIGHPAIASMTLPQDFINATRQLQVDLKMFFQQQPPLEGYRATQAASNLQTAAGADGSGVFVNPTGVAQAIREMMDVNKQLANGLKTGQFPDGVQVPNDLAGGSPVVPASPVAPKAPPPGTVAVTTKDGKTGFIPAARAQDQAYMTKYGFTLAQPVQ